MRTSMSASSNVRNWRILLKNSLQPISTALAGIEISQPLASAMFRARLFHCGVYLEVLFR